MDYQIRRDGKVAILELHGVLDVEGAPTLQAALRTVLDEEGGGTSVIVDLADVPFMDSSGLGVLIGAYRRLNGIGGRIALLNAASAVRTVLELTRTERLFEMYDTLAEAVDALR